MLRFDLRTILGRLQVISMDDSGEERPAAPEPALLEVSWTSMILEVGGPPRVILHVEQIDNRFPVHDLDLPGWLGIFLIYMICMI